ncbi:MAG: galactose mutarotase [Alteromonadales bacterium]|nr:galactose mutarotase [Alteromonadales bacterium]
MIKTESKLIKALETIILTNDYGMSVEIINIGARIKSIKFPVHSKPKEMILGYETAEEYLTDEFYLGATCGRVCNRIADGKFELDGREYQLSKNDGGNSLHGGANNFSSRYWQICKRTLTNSTVTLSLFSPNGDQGFPGNLELSVTYQLSADNMLSIKYLANTDLATPINLTNHAYFNLGENSCESLNLQIMSSSFLETDCENIATGKLVKVDDTDFNFRESAGVGERQSNSQDHSLREKHGFDHCFILDDTLIDQPKAVLTSSKNGISLFVYTDQPAMQLYTGFYLEGQFKPYQGLCLEAQNYPNAINVKHFPNSALRPREQYQRKIIFAFESIA